MLDALLLPDGTAAPELFDGESEEFAKVRGLLEKLIGVKCENEPLVGIIPDKLLCDKSSTSRFWIVVNDMGIAPDRLLLFRRRLLSFDKFPSSYGISPVKLFK